MKPRTLFEKIWDDHVVHRTDAVSYTHLRAHETVLDLVCRLLLEKQKEELASRMPGTLR